MASYVQAPLFGISTADWVVWEFRRLWNPLLRQLMCRQLSPSSDMTQSVILLSLACGWTPEVVKRMGSRRFRREVLPRSYYLLTFMFEMVYHPNLALAPMALRMFFFICPQPFSCGLNELTGTCYCTFSCCGSNWYLARRLRHFFLKASRSNRKRHGEDYTKMIVWMQSMSPYQNKLYFFCFDFFLFFFKSTHIWIFKILRDYFIFFNY